MPPFQIDPAWTPSAHRRALAIWRETAPANDSDLLPRAATATASPRHDKLSKQLRNLLTWRAMHRGDDWTLAADRPADNDNPAEEQAPARIECDYEIRPRVNEIFAALKDVDRGGRRHARLGGGGRIETVPVGGDMERGPVWGHGGKTPPDCIVRLGLLHFSNGGFEEPELVLREAKAVRGSVRIPLGGLTHVGTFKLRDRFTRPKGADNDNAPVAVGINPTAAPGSTEFTGPVADVQHAKWVGEAVGAKTAAILDHALVAANFREIGERLRFEGKTAERRGKQAVIDACGILDAALAA